MAVAPEKNTLRNLFPGLRCAIYALLVIVLGFQNLVAQRPLGTDVSNYQPTINWPGVRNAGIVFAWTKATQGTTYSSPSFTSQEAGAKSVGIYIGAYHYAQPSINTNLTGAFSAESEAAYFWGIAGNYITNGSGYLVPMLDWEDIHATNGYHGFNGFTTVFMSAWVNQWCNSVSNYAQLNGVTIRPIVYTGTWYSNPAGGYPGLNSTVTGWSAWIASYKGHNIQTGGPTSTYPWPTWTVWQYADTNWSGGDSDVLNGGYTSLDPLVIGGLPPGPFIISQPFIKRAFETGDNVTFAANALGNGALTYGWRFNGSAIPGANNATLNLTNLQTVNEGNYSFTVTDSTGSVTSSPAPLMIYPPQVTVFADDLDAVTGTKWIVNRSSADSSVAFGYDYSGLGIPPAPHSTNGTMLGLQMKANLSARIAAAVSLSPTNQNFSGDYRLHFDGWINVNGPFPDGGAGSTELLTAGIGTSGTRTEWNGSGSTADGCYFSVNGDGGSSDTTTTAADYNAYIGSTVQLTGTGDYRADTDVTARGNGNFYYTTAFPHGAAAPAMQQAFYPQQSGNLNPGTFGLAWHDVIVSKRGSTVDWVVDGIRIATISNATFNANNVSIGFWDPFGSSLPDNNMLSFGLVDNVRVEVPAAAPVFTMQPVAQSVPLGADVVFTAVATGLPLPAYQWRLNGNNLFGETNSTFSITSVSQINIGNYSVLVTNIAGSAVSTNALLALIPPNAAQFQSISVQPDGGMIQIGFTGDAAWNYVIETSTNLTDWNVLTNLTSVDGNFVFTAGATTNSQQQYFRARVGP